MRGDPSQPVRLRRSPCARAGARTIARWRRGRQSPRRTSKRPAARRAADGRVAALEALGRGAEAQAFRWACFERSLAAHHLRAFLKKLPDFEDVAAEERALAIARASKEVHTALHLLVDWPALDLAADLVVARAADLNGDLYELLSPAAEALALRAMIGFTLREARNSRYGHAARHLAARLRAEHGRKSGFWSRVG